MDWLEGNLHLAYPLGDQVTDTIINVLADGFVSAPVLGVFTLSIFNPQALTNAHVQVKQGATIILETTAATVTPLGDFTVLEGVDSVRGSRYRFICSTVAIALYPFLADPVELAPNACVTVNQVVQSLNGLTGDVELTFDKFISVATDGNTVIAAQDPVDRVDCSAVDCDAVFSIAGVLPDENGSFVFGNDGCHRIVPDPIDPNKLYIYNLCKPCLDCDDVDTLNAHLAGQADYLYQLAAIGHDQFNRYQEALVSANRQTESIEAEPGTFSKPCGMIQVAGRSFNRPYFSQIVTAITNSSTYRLSVEITATITPGALNALVSGVTGSYLVQRFGPEGAFQDTHTGLPGNVTVLVGPGETVSVSAEVHLDTIDDDVAMTGLWNVDTEVTYVSGCATLPTLSTISRTFQIAFNPAGPSLEA